MHRETETQTRLEASAVHPAPAEGGAGNRDLLALAKSARRHGLTGPAIFLLEVALPLHTLLQQVLYTGHPLLRPWLGDRLLLWAGRLEDTAALEGALQHLIQPGPPGAA